MSQFTLKDKIPPRNEEAEQATLGAPLLDPQALATVLRYLRPDELSKTAHKNIFQAIINLFNRGEAIDLLTVSDAHNDSLPSRLIIKEAELKIFEVMDRRQHNRIFKDALEVVSKQL